MDISTIFGSTSLASGDYLKNAATFTEYYESYGFFGQLTTMNTDESYALRLGAASTLTLSGVPTSLPKTILLSAGWAWVPCPYQTSVPIAVGAPLFGFEQGDQFKSQSSFSEYYAGYGWFGTLTLLEPGAGYRVKISSSGSATYSS